MNDVTFHLTGDALWARMERAVEKVNERFNVLKLEALVRMKLTSFRDRDRMHVRDMLDVGLLDVTWCKRFPNKLAARLQELIDDPEG